MNTTGQSIAAASDAVTRNGKKNTTFGWGLIVGGGIAFIAAGLGIRYYFRTKENNGKHRNTVNLVQQKHRNRMAHENQKSENRIKEMDHKQELKKQFIDYKAERKMRSSDFRTTKDDSFSEEDASVTSFDEIVAGEDVVADDLRLGLRCFHIGEDCGLIGRTQIGKTTWVLQYSMYLARGYQEEDAKLTPDWKLTQPMTVLYFAFEQNRAYFKSKYGKLQKDVPNLFIEVSTNASDFNEIRMKIMNKQNSIGNRRLLVVFDNITKMKTTGKQDRNDFFEWLESYRKGCASHGIPITYLKVYHTQGKYKDFMPLDATANYGVKTDPFFSQSLIGFGLCKGGEGRLRYVKELKNKLEQDGEKQTLSIYRFANNAAPMYDYVKEADECEVLPTKTDLIRGGGPSEGNNPESHHKKCGRPRKYSEVELKSAYEEHQAGFTWREIFTSRGWPYDDDKIRAFRAMLNQHGFRLQKKANPKIKGAS